MELLPSKRQQGADGAAGHQPGELGVLVQGGQDVGHQPVLHTDQLHERDDVGAV